MLQFRRRFWIQRFVRVISHSLDNSQTLGSTLSEQNPITSSQKLGSLHKSKSYSGPVARADIITIDINDGTSLTDRTYV